MVKKSICYVIFASLMALQGCSGSMPPDKAVGVVMDNLKNMHHSTFRGFITCSIPKNDINNENSSAWKPKTRTVECKDFTVSSAKRTELSKSEKANGIKEQWAVGVNFLIKEPDEQKWDELKICTYVAQKADDNWHIVSSFEIHAGSQSCN